MTTLQGSVRRITFRNDTNHFTVAKIDLDEPHLFAAQQEVTVVGHFPSLSVGEWIEVEGEWKVHPAFGRQFHATSVRKAPPATRRGLLRYLGSGAISGIGPKLAERIVDKFGDKTLEVIEKSPERLLEVEGIGAKKAEAIGRALQSEREARDALIFLEGLGLAPGTAAKVYRRYQGETIAKVRANPYCLAEDIFGIGFRTADSVARELGIPPDSPRRAAAALMHLLEQAAAEGHVYLPRATLLAGAAKLDIPEPVARAALEELAAEGRVVIEEALGDEAPGMEGGPETDGRARERDEPPAAASCGGWAAVYPSFLYRAEVEAAVRLRARIDAVARAGAGLTGPGDDRSGLPPAVAALARRMSLTQEQVRAVELALRPGGGLLVLTGGPGTGKTTTLRAIVEGLRALGRTYHLAAPTGRAAKRMAEATGYEAKTIHRLLEYSGSGTGGFRFQRNAQRPLTGDAVIVDEASMIDLPLLFHLLRALPPRAALILVGDADQLPSVGPGNVLADVLRAAEGCVVRLTRVFRQAQQSQIVVNAHRIQRGERPRSGGEGSDFYFVSEPDPEAARRLICELVAHRLPRYLQCDPRRDVQVLATVRRGVLGVDALNEALQEALNPAGANGAQVIVGGQSLRPGDRVMQVRNDYDKMVFNGDIGTVVAVDPKARALEVHFPDRDGPGPVVYEGDEVNQLTLAYCTSVHKSQGSEYPVVVMPVVWVMPALMHRNLLYTAVTRAKRLVVLVGREDALWGYVRNAKADERYSLLAERIARARQRVVQQTLAWAGKDEQA